MSRPNPRVVVIGAGIGGLTTAAVLAKAGLDVTVLEAHVYPGGCAGTFYHQGYRFDAGATLAGGFYPGGPMDLVAQAVGVQNWPTRPANRAMTVHLPDGASLALQAGERRWEERRAFFGPQAQAFFDWQERTADALWNFALRQPPWPPQSPADVWQLLRVGSGWLGDLHSRSDLPGFVADALRPAAAHLRGASERLRLFVDGQLLISAQTTSRQANALYAASALDLPRRGVVHLEGGMGAIAQRLVETVRQHGGRVLLRQEVVCIRRQGEQAYWVETRRGERLAADHIVANLPPANVLRLLQAPVPARLSRIPIPEDGWGAFMLYLGLEAGQLPAGLGLHHQVITRRPLGEGNSVFLSFSPAWDTSRAPAGMRALTISTHTRLEPWHTLFKKDRLEYERRKDQYTQRLMQAAARVVPGIRSASRLVLPGTPLTFQRFTRRAQGWVGGHPQTHLLRAAAPRLAPGLWLVGDSIFPGQSTPAVALGGLRVARAIKKALG